MVQCKSAKFLQLSGFSLQKALQLLVNTILIVLSSQDLKHAEYPTTRSRIPVIGPYTNLTDIDLPLKEATDSTCINFK